MIKFCMDIGIMDFIRFKIIFNDNHTKSGLT
jgi:hypothetical protein